MITIKIRGWRHECGSELEFTSRNSKDYVINFTFLLLEIRVHSSLT